jgi:Family of unknown function (DUF6454)
MMRARTYLTLVVLPVAVVMLGGSGIASPGGEPAKATRDDPLAKAIRQLDRSTAWELVDRIPLDFETYHPQGFTVVRNKLFMSSVEVIEPPVRYPEPDENGYDRSPGKGIGHVFVMTREGELIRDIVIGRGPEGTI